MRYFLFIFMIVLALRGRGQDSLFLNSEGPARPEEDLPVELGMVFRPLTSGVITHFRFYKTDPFDAQQYTLNLWALSTRQNLVRQFYTAPGISGWQRVPLSTALSVQAGVNYVVSVHFKAGRYGGRTGVFQSSRTRGNLIAPASSQVSGGNGRYLYSATTGYPAQTYLQSAYYVDVVMSTLRKPLLVNAGRDTVLITTLGGFMGDYQLHGSVSGDGVTYSWRKESPLGLADTMLNPTSLTPTLRDLAALPHTYVLRGVDKWGTISEHKVRIEVQINPKAVVMTLTRNGQPYIEIFQDGTWKEINGTNTGAWFFKGQLKPGFESDDTDVPPN